MQGKDCLCEVHERQSVVDLGMDDPGWRQPDVRNPGTVGCHPEDGRLLIMGPFTL